MSLLPQVNAYHADGKGQYDYFFAMANESAKQWSYYPALSTVQVNGYPVDFTPSTQVTTNGDNLLINGVPMTNSTILGSTITNWALYPAVSSVNFNNNQILSTTSIELDGVYITASYDEIFINGDPIVTSTAFAKMSSITEWAYYEAVSTVNMAGNFIDNCPKIVMDGNIVTTAGDYILVNASNPVENWAKFAASSNVNVNSKNINNANQLNFITAVPGPLTTGATINSLNSLNFSYATALLQQAGITNLNNIAWWNPQYPGVPAFNANMYTKVLTYAGDAGTTYIATDTNVAVPRLFLGGLLGTAGGKLEIIGDDAVYVTVNNQPCPQSWSRFRATQAVDFNTNQATRCGGIDFTLTGNAPFNLLTINAGGFLTAAGNLIVTSPASENINVNNFGLTNVRDVSFNGAGKLLATNVGGALTYDGAVITTGSAGNASNWAQYNANHNVVIPPAYNFSMNPANSVTFFPDCTLNANIYHGVSGSLVAPDFISFPTTFQVGNTANPAREITMTAGAEGFGINSLTEVNIDATALVNIFSDGIVSIEAIADINLSGVLATFEFGEFNIAAAATTMEVDSFDVVSVGNITLAAPLLTGTFAGTTLAAGAFGLTALATVFGVATWNLTSAGNVTTVGTQIGFTAGTKFETLSSGDTNLIANGIMSISSLSAINLGAPIVNMNNVNVSTLTVSTVNAYNLSTVNLTVESVFTPPGIGAVTFYENITATKNIACYSNITAPYMATSTLYGTSGATIGGNLWLEAPLVTATGNLRVTNTLFSDDARFTGQTTLSSIQQFVGQAVTFANSQTNMPNNVTISTLTVQTVNGLPYPVRNPIVFVEQTAPVAIPGTTPVALATGTITLALDSKVWVTVNTTFDNTGGGASDYIISEYIQVGTTNYNPTRTSISARFSPTVPSATGVSVQIVTGVLSAGSHTITIYASANVTNTDLTADHSDVVATGGY